MVNRRITIDELSELLELGTWMRGYKGYIVTENFKGKEKRIFNVIDLHIEQEQDYIMFFDHNDILLNSVLMAQLKESILSICHCCNGKCLHEDIKFCTGNVYIDSISA